MIKNRNTIMITRVAIFPYGASEGVKTLRDEINKLLGFTEEDDNQSARILLRNGRSRFRGNDGDLVVNWGSRATVNFDAVVGNAISLNSAEHVANAALKDKTFAILKDSGVPTLEHTSDKALANSWLEAGEGVFSRGEISGHSGDGIVYCAQETPHYLGCNVIYSNTLPEVSLYTKAITDIDRKEFRVHVFDGKVISIQQKRRKNGWRGDDNYSSVVRNFGNGWIFATSAIEPTDLFLKTSIDAVAALNLTFGAIDMMVDTADVAYVVEVNTAPGLDGESTKTAYASAIVACLRGEEVVAAYPYSPSADLTASVAVVAPDFAAAMQGSVATHVWVNDAPTSNLEGAVLNLPRIFNIPDGLAANLLHLLDGNRLRAEALVSSLLNQPIVTINENRNLIDAFPWDRTSQGHEFWSCINNMEYNSPIVSDWFVGRSLHQVSQTPVQEETITPQDSPVPYISTTLYDDKIWFKLLKDSLGEQAARGIALTLDPEIIWADAFNLDSLMNWGDSDQGHEYWETLHNRVMGTSNEPVPSLDPQLAPRSTSSLFKIIADVMGEANAEMELGKLANEGITFDVDAVSLFGAFVWTDSPQGETFWNMVSNGLMPSALIVEPPSAPTSSVRPSTTEYILNAFYKLTQDAQETVGKYEGDGMWSIIGYDLQLQSNSFNSITAI